MPGMAHLKKRCHNNCPSLFLQLFVPRQFVYDILLALPSLPNGSQFSPPRIFVEQLLQVSKTFEISSSFAPFRCLSFQILFAHSLSLSLIFSHTHSQFNAKLIHSFLSLVYLSLSLSLPISPSLTPLISNCRGFLLTTSTTTNNTNNNNCSSSSRAACWEPQSLTKRFVSSPSNLAALDPIRSEASQALQLSLAPITEGVGWMVHLPISRVSSKSCCWLSYFRNNLISEITTAA